VAVYTFAANEAARIYRKAGTGVSGLTARGTGSIAISMPLPWMVDGFALAVRRYAEADAPESVDAKEACIPLFEALSWLNAINETFAPASLKGNRDVRASVRSQSSAPPQSCPGAERRGCRPMGLAPGRDVSRAEAG
jgi:hypothetical protein